MDNGTGGFGRQVVRYATPEESMAAYDELPRVFRRLIGEASFKMSPQTVHDLIRDFGIERAAEHIIVADEEMAMAMRREQEALAGIHLSNRWT